MPPSLPGELLPDFVSYKPFGLAPVLFIQIQLDGLFPLVLCPQVLVKAEIEPVLSLLLNFVFDIKVGREYVVFLRFLVLKQEPLLLLNHLLQLFEVQIGLELVFQLKHETRVVFHAKKLELFLKH